MKVKENFIKISYAIDLLDHKIKEIFNAIENQFYAIQDVTKAVMQILKFSEKNLKASQEESEIIRNFITGINNIYELLNKYN